MTTGSFVGHFCTSRVNRTESFGGRVFVRTQTVRHGECTCSAQGGKEHDAPDAHDNPIRRRLD
eukprot:scaffold252104_cov36-Prasinocladus_malaysianus.AAC.2